MNKKKLLVMLSSIALLAVVGVGATLAYFTDSTNIVNNIVTGYVDISISENAIDPETGEMTTIWDYDIENDDIENDGYAMEFENVMPGDVLDKDPTISLRKASQSAYVRVKITLPTGEDEVYNSQMNELYKNIKDTMVGSGDWAYNQNQDMFYFQNVLNAESSANLFRTITIPASWDNTLADHEFDIVIQAEAIQSANFENSLGYNSSDKINRWIGFNPINGLVDSFEHPVKPAILPEVD